MEKIPDVAIETEGEGKKHEQRERIPERIARAIRIVAFSGIAWFGMHAGQQGSEKSSAKEIDKTSPQIENVQDFLHNNRANNQRKWIENQRMWLAEYITSEKYYERLEQEYLRFKLHYNKNNQSSYLSMIGREEKKPVVLSENIALDEIFPKVNIDDVSDQIHEDKTYVKYLIQERLKAIKNTPWSIVNSLPSEPGRVTFGGYYGKYYHDKTKAGTIELSELAEKTSFTTPVHEYTHASTNGELNMLSTTNSILNERAENDWEYLNNPTEILARMNVLRFLMDKNELYDAGSEEFTEDHYDKIFSYPEIMEDHNIQQLLQTLSKEDLIWFMNNIADAKPQTNESSDEQNLT